MPEAEDIRREMSKEILEESESVPKEKVSTKPIRKIPKQLSSEEPKIQGVSLGSNARTYSSGAYYDIVQYATEVVNNRRIVETESASPRRRGRWIAPERLDYNVWEESDTGHIYLNNPNERPNAVMFDSLQDLYRRCQDRYEEILLRRSEGITTNASEYEDDIKNIRDSYNDIRNIPLKNFEDQLDENHKSKKASKDDVDAVNENEEIIINFVELADFYAREEYQIRYKGRSVLDNPEIYAQLVKDHKKRILMFKRNTNA